MSYLIFARWFGLISIILSLGILFNLEDAKAMARNMVDGESGYIMGGVLPIIFGSLAFMQHNRFVPGWQIVVTLIGLFMLVIGAYRVLFVNSWKRLISRHLNKVPFLFSLFGLILGCLLLYVGFFVPLSSIAPPAAPLSPLVDDFKLSTLKSPYVHSSGSHYGYSIDIHTLTAPAPTLQNILTL